MFTVDSETQKRLGLPPFAVPTDRADSVIGIATDADDRMNREMDRVAQSVKRHPNRIDKERHVRRDDFNDGVP